jgi:hypothetical protein
MNKSRKTEYAVIPVTALRGIYTRSNEEVVHAQEKIDDKMIRALEELVNAAKSRSLNNSEKVLAMGAVAW